MRCNVLQISAEIQPMAGRRKTNKNADFPRHIRFEDAVVKVYRRRDGMFIACWREDGRRRTTTKAGEENALTWAEAKARQLGQATGRQWVSPAHAEMIQTLQRLAGPGEGAMGKLISEVAAAKALLAGRADLATAARWFRDFGPQHADPVSVPEAARRFLAEYDGGSKATRRTFGTEVDAWAEEFRGKMLHEITEPMLRRWVDRRTKGDGQVPAPRTVLSRITTLTTLFRRAKLWGVLPEQGKTAPERLRRPKIPSASREIFTPEQGRALLEVVMEEAPRLAAFLLLGGWLGLRPSEAVRVRREDVDLEKGYLHATIEAVLKTGQERYVPIEPRVVPWLRKAMEGKAPEERVCVYRSREYLSLLAREKGVVEKWPSDVLRHSYCSYRLAIVGDIGRVAEEAGNSPKMIREHYRRPLKPEDGEAWWELLSRS